MILCKDFYLYGKEDKIDRVKIIQQEIETKKFLKELLISKLIIRFPATI